MTRRLFLLTTVLAFALSSHQLIRAAETVAKDSDRSPATAKPKLPQPSSRTTRKIEGWNVRVDDRLLQPANKELGERALRFLEAKLVDIEIVVPGERLKQLKSVTIVLDLNCGDLGSMQYHPGADWLTDHGYPAELV